MTNCFSEVLAPQGLDGRICMLPSMRAQGLKHESVMWSNVLVDAPIVYSLLERRLLYRLTLEVKHRFTEKNLAVPDSWQDLYFQLTDADLGLIGGRTNVLQTYEALSEIGKKFITVSFKNDKGETVIGNVHWVDTFFYNTETRMYDVRVSPEVMPYLINLSKSFTSFDVATAMMMSSKFGQKFYELCCQFSGEFRFTDNSGNVYKKNVVPLDIDYIRRIFNLEEQKDPRTGKVITKGKYRNFNDIRRRIIEPAQLELNQLYITGRSNVWFDYAEGDRVGRKIKNVLIFVYTKDNPKKENSRIWQRGDEPLCPLETENSKITAKDRLAKTMETWSQCSDEELEMIFGSLLRRYLKPEESGHYLHTIKALGGKRHDMYIQAIQSILDKEGQPKFAAATLAYKRKSIIQYALQDNLKQYGWHMTPPKSERRSKAVRTPSFTGIGL